MQLMSHRQRLAGRRHVNLRLLAGHDLRLGRELDAAHYVNGEPPGTQALLAAMRHRPLRDDTLELPLAADAGTRRATGGRLPGALRLAGAALMRAACAPPP